MLTIITGLPGAGKTLHTIWRVQRFRAAETAAARKTDASSPERPVYQFGINGLTLDWIEFTDIKEWPSLPAGSIIVVDEAQRQLPVMAPNAARPEHYTEIDTHRHKGFDIILITQDAMLIDQRFRAMCERHIHLSRSYGLPASTVYEWKGVQRTTGVTKLDDKSGVVSQWKYPKELFEVYKSAEVHTHKPRLPWKKLATIGATLALAVGLILYAVLSYRSRTVVEPETMAGGEAVAAGAGGAAQVFGGASGGGVDPWSDMARFEPRVAGFPASAPAYAGGAPIVEAPRVDGCSLLSFTAESGAAFNECSCNDQRGNRIEVPADVCLSFVRGGFFDPTIATR